MSSTRSVYCKGLLLSRTPPRHRSVHQAPPAALSPTQLWIVEPTPREYYTHPYTNVSQTRQAVRNPIGDTSEYEPTYDPTNAQCYCFVGTVFEALKSLIVPHDLGYCILIGAKASSSSAGVTVLRQETDISVTLDTVGHQRSCHTHVLLDLVVIRTICSTQLLCHTYPIIFMFVDATL
ncbi:hypothetical protein EV401DRAFT_1910637 [Pisolithus croceorrhizus]|nr:hypothetical protein EV401DRAFT_1910637 [Pisolithus croceorrhizus]